MYLAKLQRDELITSSMSRSAAYFPLQLNDQPRLQAVTLKSNNPSKRARPAPYNSCVSELGVFIQPHV